MSVTIKRREEASPVRQMFTNSTPMPVVAELGVCAVKPDARFGWASPAVASPLAARFPQAHQVQIQMILPTVSFTRSYMGPETKPSIKLGGFRGVPPRGRPV